MALGAPVEIEIWNTDAAEVSLPPEPLALFLNHPFCGPVMERSTNLERSLSEAPRPVFVLYDNPVLAEKFDAVSVLERAQGGPSGWSGGRDPKRRLFSPENR